METNVHFIGLLRSPVSWAKVGREAVKALASAGARVSAVSLKGYLYDQGFALHAEVEAAVARERRDGWDLALDYPPNFARLSGRRRAGILIYEADLLPPHWAEAARETLDLAFVPSEFCLEAAAAAGVPREMLRIAPFGVNASVYSPGASDAPTASPTGRAFNFLAVAAPHVRKGLSETVAAFREAFSPGDDAGLVIKCPPVDRLGRRPWEYKSVEAFLPDARGGRIALVAESLGEAEMAALYRSADAYVQASYGEGFGLAIAEALSCGVPVIATAWGAATGYLDASNALLVACDSIDASAFAYDWPKDAGIVRMARPRVGELAQAMRRVYEDADLRARLTAGGIATARAMTWDRFARAVLDALAEYDEERRD